MIHTTKPVKVWADVDSGVVLAVSYLNTIEGVRTLASCQGTIGSGGAEPYRAQVMVSWTSDEIRDRLAQEFDLEILGDGVHGYIRPKSGAVTFVAPATELADNTSRIEGLREAMQIVESCTYYPRCSKLVAAAIQRRITELNAKERT